MRPAIGWKRCRWLIRPSCYQWVTTMKSISAPPKHRSILSLLPQDVAGIRPQTQIWTAAGGVCQTERYTIDAPNPAERLQEFSRKVMGNNSIFYSIYRTSTFVPLLQFFTRAHPTKGGYCDWSLSFAPDRQRPDDP